MNSIESLQNRGKGAAVTRKHGYRIDTSSIKAQHAAEEMMLQIENDMKNASAKLAAEQAERMVQDSIKASMERIDSENENMRTWEENMVRRSGYHVDGKNIHREAVVDSSLGHTYYEGQNVHYYEDFYDAGPKISVSFSKEMLNGLTSSAIMLLVEQANLDIENWTTDIFGKVEKDDEGNSTLKQNYIARDSGNNSKIDAYKKLAKKDYDSLSETEQKKFDNLSELIVTVRDGKLGEWIGYAPQFKNGKDNAGNEDKNNKDLEMDLSKGRDWNIKHPGSGQMGKIMLDFQWNNMIEQQGWQKVALPAYDQPLWRGNGSWFEPPTIRGISSIVFEVVGTASGQKWFSYADDVIFAAIDLGGGFKSAEQVGLDLAKTAATAVISMGCSAAGSALSSSVSAAMDGAGKAMEGAGKFANFAAQAGISAATSYATSVGTSFVNNWNLDADGKLAFDAESFGKSTYSAQTIAGSVGAGVTAGLTTAANMKMQKMGDNGAAVNKFYGTAVNAGITAAGKLSEYAVYSAYALAEGRTLADAYDDMGGLTFNIGSLGMFADMMASGIARNNATGQAGTFGEIAQKLSGMGVLEINIGSNGITGKFGMGGFDLAGALYTLGKRMSDKAALEAYAMQEGVSKDEAESVYWGYVYGDWTQENASARISSERDEFHIVDEMADGANAQTVQKADGTGRVITMKDTGDYHTNAITLGHESYRDGIVGNKAEQQRETFNAVVGHAGMAARMDDYGTHFDGLLGAEVEAYKKGDMTALMMDSLYNYSSDADYWKLISRSDGTHSIEWDRKRDITVEYQDKDEDGNWEKVSEDFFKDDTGSMAGSLGKLVGKTRATEILGSSLYNADLYDSQTLKDVLGLPDEKIARIQRSGIIPSDISELQLYKLAGEALMKKNGITWDTSNGENAGFWNVSGLETTSNGNKLTNFTLTDNTTMGYILLNQQKFDPNSNAKGNTYFDRFVVTTELNRNPNSWDAYYMRSEDPQGDSYNHTFDTNKSLESQNRGLDEIIYRKYDLQNNQIGKDFVTYAQTIDVYNTIDNHKNKDGSYTKINRSQPYYIFGQGWGQGNTVNSNFSLTVNSLNTSNEWVMTIHNFYTIGNDSSHNWVNASSSNGLPGGAWGVHSSGYLTSDGCFIYTEENRKALQKKLKEWGLHTNHQIYGTLK